MTTIFTPPRQTVLMRRGTDCEVAALATALGITWEQARDLLSWRDLPGPLENPVFGNPWNLYRALIRAGYWKYNITLADLLNGRCEPGKTIVLVKKSTTQQHWVVWAGINGFGQHQFYWGDSKELRLKSPGEVRALFTAGAPANCAFQVYKANIWRLMLARVQGLFN